MKVKILSRERIKPSSSTPKTYNLSLFDQISPPSYIKVFFFYQNYSNGNPEAVIAERSQRLKSSLSEALNRYYPFAGRIIDQVTVGLNEKDGAEFLEARVSGTLSEYLAQPNDETLEHLAPSDLWDFGTRPLLIIQASFFTCGGLALGINFSHKVSDGATCANFMKAWTNAAMGNFDDVVDPDFSGSLTFPAVEDALVTGEKLSQLMKRNTVTKRFMFSGPHIASLQEKAIKGGVEKPSRVETITAFVWRIRTKMLTSKAGNSQIPPPKLVIAVNLRRNLPLPICDQTFGNVSEGARVENPSGDTEMHHLISLLRGKIVDLRESYGRNPLEEKHTLMNRFVELSNKDSGKLSEIKDDKWNALILVSSWCRFPFYETDFGWGKPTWVTTHHSKSRGVMLMDTKDCTGIEARVSFPEEDMVLFENDEELLTYATQDPSRLD